MRNVSGKVVLITGAGRGIGKRLAMGFASAGARVALLARSRPELDLVHLEIEQGGGTALRLRADVRHIEELKPAIDQLLEVFGPPDVLFCAAGIQGPVGAFADCPPEEWMDTIMTNLVGACNTVRVALPLMLQRRSGKIILLGGGGAAEPRPNFSAYSASKGGLVRFSETLAEEVRESNIQVNVMSPGGAYTHMTDEILNAGDRAGTKELDRALEVRLTGGISTEKQLELAIFLASQDSNHISGKMIHVNDDWRRLEHSSANRDLYTVRRNQRA